MQSVGTKQRRKILAKLKSDEDLDDYDPYNDVQISDGKMYTQIESTTIDGIIFFSCHPIHPTSNSLCRLGKWDQFTIHVYIMFMYKKIRIKDSMYTRPSLLSRTISNRFVQK